MTNIIKFLATLPNIINDFEGWVVRTCQISPSQAPLTGHFVYTSPRQCATINNETSWVALLGLLTERLSSMQRST